MLPPTPDVPADQRASGSYPLRFDDLTQRGHLRLEPIVASLGAALWRPLLERHSLVGAFRADGVRPIFTFVAIEANDVVLDLSAVLTARGAYELAHARAADGSVARLFLNMWTEVTATTREKGEPAVVARLFGEHVLTRFEAPPERRRVTALPDGEVPRAVYTQPRPDSLLELPEGATWLDSELFADPTPLAFGLAHTDSNQHVNSLVYPRLFEEAALRRIAAMGLSTVRRAQTLEMSFRKPFFAGETAKTAFRLFAIGDSVGAAGVFLPAAPAAKPHAFLRLLLSPPFSSSGLKEMTMAPDRPGRKA